MALVGHYSPVNDDIPRPYADEPPATDPASGLELLRVRPWALAATALLTLLLMIAQPVVTSALIRSGEYRWEMAPWFLYPVLGALPAVVSLTVVAVLARRRVTPGRALGLMVASVLLLVGQTRLFGLLPSLAFGDHMWLHLLLWPVVEVLTLLCIGSLGAVLFPPVTGRNALGVRLAASVVAAVLSAALSFLSAPGPDPAPVGWAAVQAVITVGWAIAALVTSRPPVLAWAGDPAEQVRQDP